MSALTIKFDNGYEFDIDRVLRNTGIPKGASVFQSETVDTISITAPLISKKDMSEQLTPKNMEHFTVFRDGVQLTEYTGYSDITLVTETIDKTQQTFTVEARYKE